jgi:NAD-dependent deacetylase
MTSPELPLPAALLDALARARRVVAFSGAGMSAESGVPTFRDAQTGLWARFSPEELATPEAFAADPKRVQDWYAWRMELTARAQPNAGHAALAELAKRVEVVVVTQNVDGLHAAAGSPDIVELHGRLRWVRVGDRTPVETPMLGDDGLRRCPASRQLLRPDVVWFGESLPQGALERAFRDARTSDLLLAIGTSGLVQPAASIPVAALAAGRPVIEINPDRTPLSAHVSGRLAGRSAEALPGLCARIGPSPP